MLLLNILPVLLALLLFFFLTRKIGFSCSLVGIVLIFFAVVDRVKVSMRQEPLLPTDLTLAKEVIAILKTFPRLSAGADWGHADCIRGTSGMQLSEIEGYCTAASAADSGACACAPAALGPNHLWYANQTLYDSYPTVDNPYFQVNQYNTRGMIYSFLHQFNIMQVKAPEGYTAADIRTLEDTDWTPLSAQKSVRTSL